MDSAEANSCDKSGDEEMNPASSSPLQVSSESLCEAVGEDRPSCTGEPEGLSEQCESNVKDGIQCVVANTVCEGNDNGGDNSETCQQVCVEKCLHAAMESADSPPSAPHSPTLCPTEKADDSSDASSNASHCLHIDVYKNDCKNEVGIDVCSILLVSTSSLPAREDNGGGVDHEGHSTTNQNIPSPPPWPPVITSANGKNTCSLPALSLNSDSANENRIIPEPPPPPPLPSSASSPVATSSPSVAGKADDVTFSQFMDLLPGYFVDELSAFELSLESAGSDVDQIGFPFITGSCMYLAECTLCFETEHMYRRTCCKMPVCQQCLAAYFNLMVREGKVSIPCPSCSNFVHRSEVNYFLDKDTKLKFYQFLIKANRDQNKKLCPRCSRVTEMPAEIIRDPKLKKCGLQICCASCSLVWCFLCEAPWHDGMTCKEYRVGDKLLRVWAKEETAGSWNAQKCPNCKAFIERTAGCDHMTCGCCSTEFCYLCGERFRSLKYIGNHYKKLSILGCKYRFKPEKPAQRKFVRGSIFGLKILCVPVITAAALVVGTAVVGLGTVALPAWGAYKIHKKRETKKRAKRYQARMAALRAPCSCSMCSGKQVDPYLDQWHRQRHELDVLHDLDNLSDTSSVWSTAGDATDDVWAHRDSIQVEAQVSSDPDPVTLSVAPDKEVTWL